MKPRSFPVAALLCGALGGALHAQSSAGSELKERNEKLVEEVRQVHELSDAQHSELQKIFSTTPFLGQGNPAIARHPLTPEQCAARRQGSTSEIPGAREICGGPNMAPLYDPATGSAADATVCIDQFEFPNIACAYPVVWVRASEAAQICQAMGKRLCDAHEWEGGCAGQLLAPDYDFDLARGKTSSAAVSAMRQAHNRGAKASASWSYGPAYQNGICAAASEKSPGCDGGGWSKCGSNTYPAGSFPQCKSPLGVYDLNGNAAEHMNLPLDPAQMGGVGGLGVTEMKGSWFIFDSYRAHEDWCRWRAPFWHGTAVRDPESHHNYHLGFRCCRDLDADE